MGERDAEHKAPAGASAAADFGAAATPAAPAGAHLDESSTPFLKKLCGFAHGHGFTITATTNGHHVSHSLHYRGRAIDVSVHGKNVLEIVRFIKAAQAAGFHVLDERRQPKGETAWSGPHLHIEDREGL